MFKETQEGGGRKEEKIKGSLEGTAQKAAFLFTFSSPPCFAVSPCHIYIYDKRREKEISLD